MQAASPNIRIVTEFVSLSQFPTIVRVKHKAVRSVTIQIIAEGDTTIVNYQLSIINCHFAQRNDLSPLSYPIFEKYGEPAIPETRYFIML